MFRIFTITILSIGMCVSSFSFTYNTLPLEQFYNLKLHVLEETLETTYTTQKDIVIKLITDHIKFFEGFRATPYRDTVNSTNILIGYGKNITSSKLKIKHMTEKEACNILEGDLSEAYDAMCKNTWFTELDEIRQSAILDLAFNIGIYWDSKFPTVVKHLENKNYELASTYLIKKDNGIPTKYKQQVGKRASAVAHALRYGEWKEHDSISYNSTNDK